MRRAVIALLTSSFLAVVGVAVLPGTTANAAGGFNFATANLAASNLVAPWGMAFLDDGSALVSERDSARIVRVGVGRPLTTVATVSGVVPGGEGGLLGLAVQPGSGTDPWVYAYYTSATDNRIVRFRLSTPASQQVILQGLAKAQFHNGGRIAFGPDGMLYAGVGDATATANAQNLASQNGKILRMTPDGGVPTDNPFSGSRVYSYGHRNVQGLTWDAQGRLWATEFGQNTWDELNLIVAGGNYGWPTVEGQASDPRFHNPVVQWTTAEASPSGAAFANGTVFAAALRGTRLWTVPINTDGSVGTPVAELNGSYGRLRTVAVGPDGYLWVATSNRDGRGTPASTDDRILRFPPSGGTTTTTTSTPTTTTPTTTTTTPTTTTRPTTTTSSTPTTTTTSTATTGCSAVVRTVGQWPGGFQGEVTVTNGATPRSTWTVTFTFPNGQQLTQGWGGTFSQAGATVAVGNAPWNGTLGAGASAWAGFLASSTGTNGPPTEATCR